MSSPSLQKAPLFQTARFRDRDELSALIQGGSSEFMQKAPGAFAGEFTFVGLDHGMIQFGDIDLPHLAGGVSQNNYFGVLFNLSAEPDWVWRGQSLDPHALIAMAPRSDIQMLMPAQTSWAFLSMEYEPLGQSLVALTGSDAPLFEEGSRLLVPTADSHQALRTRLGAVLAAVRRDPTLLEVPEARKGLEQWVITSLARVLGSSLRVRPSHRSWNRARVARSVEAFLDSAPIEQISLSDLCAVAGVSERTLRDVFQENYRMSPSQYLRMRRLHQVRRALGRANADLQTVQSVANRHGIFHLGRFAADYRSLFNESPAETLRRPPGRDWGSAPTTSHGKARRSLPFLPRPN
ncbi:MAG TPA: helix-turn-helix transcriptional regulator [Candidatus Polarisedimenticolia bacterium]|nr:helix-turn-helix transcriptional regulator [Candidatus Polarisedimenticolia bacterium]